MQRKRLVDAVDIGPVMPIMMQSQRGVIDGRFQVCIAEPKGGQCIRPNRDMDLL
jgi:hypothetical protein